MGGDTDRWWSAWEYPGTAGPGSLLASLPGCQTHGGASGAPAPICNGKSRCSGLPGLEEKPGPHSPPPAWGHHCSMQVPPACPQQVAATWPSSTRQVRAPGGWWLPGSQQPPSKQPAVSSVGRGGAGPGHHSSLPTLSGPSPAQPGAPGGRWAGVEVPAIDPGPEQPSLPTPPPAGLQWGHVAMQMTSGQASPEPGPPTTGPSSFLFEEVGAVCWAQGRREAWTGLWAQG